MCNGTRESFDGRSQDAGHQIASCSEMQFCDVVRCRCRLITVFSKSDDSGYIVNGWGDS